MPSLKNKILTNRSTKLDLLFLLIGLGLIAYALFHVFDWYTHSQGTGTAPNPGHVVTVSPDKPDEKPVPHDASYNVPADQPKKILIPSIGAEGFVQQVGEDQRKEIGTPSNINYAGWYVGSVRPGDIGLSIVDGHVGGRYNPALFAKLKNLQKGDGVTVQFGDDSFQNFEVVEKNELPKNKVMPYLLKKYDDIDRQLNLITCSGTFNKKSQQYANRVVVVTKRIN